MTLTGIVTDNLGVGFRTIAKQKPFFRPTIPEIDKYRNGTINLYLNEAVSNIVAYDHYIKNLRWDDTAPALIEDFGFIKINELRYNGKKYQEWGYIYLPMASPNRKNNRLIELVGMDVPDIQHGGVVKVTISDNRMILVHS